MLEKIKNRFNSKKEEINKFNSISKPTNVGLNILFGILAALCIVPFIFLEHTNIYLLQEAK